MTFQRDVNVSGMSFSPFGAFNVRSFAMAAKGGFKNGSLLGINKIFADVKLSKLIRRELYVNEFFVDGINLKLNYENGRKFDYESFFSNVKFIFMQEGKRIGIVKKIEINNIILQNANIDMNIDNGNIKFKNIVLMSALFDSGSEFNGDISFDFEFKDRQYNAVLKFVYDNVSNNINIVEIRCKDFLLNATGNIGLLENGRISLDFNVSAGKDFFVNILNKITGGNYLKEIDSSSEIIENVNVVYAQSDISGNADK
jgi:hypothetical protein